MYTPCLIEPPRFDKTSEDGLLKVNFTNLKNAHQRVRYFRLIEFEPIGDIQCTRRQYFHNNNHVECGNGVYCIIKTTCKIQTRKENPNKKTCRMSPSITIPKVGMCTLKGVLPFLTPYIKYTAVAEYIPSSLKTKNSRTFKILEITKAVPNAKTDLRLLDLKHILEEDNVGLGHLFHHIVDESTSRQHGIRRESLMLGDPWSFDNLSSESNIATILTKVIPESNWYKIMKYSLIIKIYPNLAPYILNQFTKEELNSLVKYLSDTLKNWVLVITPFHLVKLYPHRFKNLFVDPYDDDDDDNNQEKKGDTVDSILDWISSVKNHHINQKIMHYIKPNDRELKLTPLKKQIIQFYKEEIEAKIMKSNDTACILSDVTFVEKLKHSNNNERKYGLISKVGLNEVLKILLNLEAIVQIDRTLVEKTYSNLQLKPQSEGEDVVILEKRRMFLLKHLPSNCFTLPELWNFGSNIISRIFKMKEERQLNSDIISRLDDDHTRPVVTNDILYPTKGIHLTPEQCQAIEATLKYPIVNVIGMPGTGKTLFIEALCKYYNTDDEIHVAVVTHGSCMANELRQRGIRGALNIHMVLKHCKSKSTHHHQEDSQLSYNPKLIRILVIDEFSNVSDEVASLIYDDKIFPNLQCIVHVFDPIQTQPIGNGSLSIDYFNTFPKYEFICKRPHYDTLGVTIKLNKCHRFDNNGYIGLNDNIIVDGSKKSLLWDDVCFKKEKCEYLPDGDELKATFAVCGLTKKVESLFNTPKTRLTNLPLWKELINNRLYRFGGGGDDDDNDNNNDHVQLLALTNDDCNTINNLCDKIIQTFTSTGDHHHHHTPRLCRGHKILVREHREKEIIPIPIKCDLEEITSMIRYCQSNFFLHDDLLSKCNRKDVEINTSHSYYRNMLKQDFDNYDFHAGVEELEALNSNVVSTNGLYNGTIFTFIGVIDLYTKSITKEDLLRAIKIQERQTMVNFNTTFRKIKGVGSRKKKNEQLSIGIGQQLANYSCENIMRMLIRLEKRRWAVSNFELTRNVDEPYDYISACIEEVTTRSKITTDVLLPYIPEDNGASLLYVDQKYDINHKIRFIVSSTGGLYRLDSKHNTLSLFQSGWAITVDFSQGKEYKTVGLVIPTTVVSRPKRKLVDTVYHNFDRSHIHVAITRAKKQFILFGEPDDMQTIAARNSERLSTTRFTFMEPLLKYLNYCLILDSYQSHKQRQQQQTNIKN